MSNFLVGLRIVGVRAMTDQEREDEGWEGSPHHATVLVLSDGTILYPSCDEEGNGPGALFGQSGGEAIFIHEREADYSS